jgi:hypothetical protein
MRVSAKSILFAMAALAAPIFVAAPAQAVPMVTYIWTTTSEGFGPHVDKPTTASFQVPLADVLAGKILQNDITNIQLTYPGLTFNTTVTSSGGFDFAAFVNPVTGAFIYHDVNQGLSVEAFAGTDINQATTFLSITVDAVAYTSGGQPLTSVKDQFNALNNGNAFAGFPTAGFWTAQLPATGGVPEPATWAMLIAGFGGVGAMMRRRRSRALTA